MKYLVLLVSVCLIGCAKNKTPTLEFHGAANAFVQTEAKAFGGIAAIENSIVQWQGETTYFYDPDYNATMVMSSSAGTSLVMDAGARFSYVLAHQGTLYAYVTRGGDVYRLQSTNGTDWTDEGVVLTHDADPTSPEHQLWNSGVAVDDSGVWHMLVESADATPGQGTVGLTYYMSLNGLQWNRIGKPLMNAGNPFVTYVPGKGLLVIHGQVNDPQAPFGAEWYTTISTFDGTTWLTHKDKFTIGTPGVHVCDPHAIETSTGVLLTVSVDQNSIYKTEATGESFETLWNKLRE